MRLSGASGLAKPPAYHVKVKESATVLLFALLTGFTAAADDPVLNVGKGVTAPKILHKPDPKYSEEARREHVQGTALYSIVVDKSGHTRDIEVLSPIGYGLDEKGVEAIQQWLFSPGMKDGAPVSIRAQIEVNFRFPGIPFDEKKEQFRTDYNKAIHDLQTPGHKAKGIDTMLQLAGKKFTPAMALVGQWMIDGHDVPKDEPGGLDLLRKAADKYDRDALYYLGRLYETGRGVPADPDKALKLIRDASMEGNDGARLYLGVKYANGKGVPADPERARYYFRLCAAHNLGTCQLGLGQLLLQSTGGRKDVVAAAAWLELAQDNSVPGADRLADDARKSLSEEELAMVPRLKAQLIRR
jgi:TonB family protein